MTIASLQNLAALLKDHPQEPLDLYRSLSRVHQHQRRAGIKPLFPLGDLGRMLGLDEAVIVHEWETANQEVGRAIRASTHGDRHHHRGYKGRPQRYVTEDGRLITY